MSNVDDSARGLPISTATAAAAMIRDESKPPPFATCPIDGEPLVFTFERRGVEFACLGGCGGWYGFLAPKPADPTPELKARHAELQARFDAGERP